MPAQQLEPCSGSEKANKEKEIEDKGSNINVPESLSAVLTNSSIQS